MSLLNDLVRQYGETDCRDLGLRHLEMLRESLKKDELNGEIQSAEDANNYIDLLRKFREALAETDKLKGDNYPQLLNSLLSVGEDGLYSNSLRFIYELIQNVDDCDYSDAADCALDMHFDFIGDRIVLTYNETGFTTFNVFAITGIAEAAKNISAAKNEIGEKGIGFKSVFGVAKSVLIESGWFSFELKKDEFTIPIPTNSGEHVNGTRMTLYIPDKKVRDIYLSIEKQYYGKDALFTRNPLLFLNKLSKLKMYNDCWDKMEFNVTRGTPDATADKVIREDDVVLSVELKSRTFLYNGKKEIKGVRYTLPAVYSLQACRSRYGNDTKLGVDGGKRMNLCAVIPYPEYINDVGNGSLYSFLLTQIHLTVPMVCHVPFKLDASREFVDPQNNNRWFSDSCDYLLKLLDYAYNDLKKTVKSDIVRYLCGSGYTLFDNTNEKIRCLSEKEGFSGRHFLGLPLFCVGNDEYCKSDEITVINPDETKQPALVHELIGLKKRLFIPPAGAKVGKFGISVVQGINELVFSKVLSNPEVTKRGLEYLSGQENLKGEYEKVRQIANIQLTVEQIIEISAHKEIFELFAKDGVNSIEKKSKPVWGVYVSKFDDIREQTNSIEIEDLPSAASNYLGLIGYKCCLADAADTFYFAAKNVIVLSKNNLLKSLENFCVAIDKNGLYHITVEFRNASQDLNRLDQDDSVSPKEYLNKLRDIRRSLKILLGDTYKIYVKQILESGASPERFIDELLQNADDCSFPEGVTPEFSLTVQGNSLISKCNECGFTKANVRSITAIGESTKRELLNNNSIGEKGIGFKTVFGVASSVAIHSNGFYFRLTDDAPTVPRSTDKAVPGRGTTMEFELKSGFKREWLTESKVLQLCLCLRQLKKITVAGFIMEIKDTENKREIVINGKKYGFFRYIHCFTIEDKEAISARKENGRDISRVQKIICYLPDGSLEKQSDGRLYCGLPTETKVNVPLNIDAPFMLSTSRNYILHGNKWNEIVRVEVYRAITGLILAEKHRLRSSVLRLVGYKLSQSRFVMNMFSDDMLNKYDWLPELRKTAFLPTFDEKCFVAPNDRCKRYPPVVNYALRKSANPTSFNRSALDVPADEYDVALAALGCYMVSAEEAIQVIEGQLDKFVADDNYRKSLYPYLFSMKADIRDKLRPKLRMMKLIPVYPVNGTGVKFVEWKDDRIFTKPGCSKSAETYYVLNENLLSKQVCEVILGVSINEMNKLYEDGRYRKNLKEKFDTLTGGALYKYILEEFNSGMLSKFDCMGEVLSLKQIGRLPMKNSSGTITTRELFVGNGESEMLFGSIKNEISVHSECKALAEKIGFRTLSEIHYNDIWVRRMLNEDDIETFQDKFFKFSGEILGGYINDKFISDEHIEKYCLTGLKGVIGPNVQDYGGFPNDAVGNIMSLRVYIAGLWKTPLRIEKVEEKRSVSKVMINGKDKGIDSSELRGRTIELYSPKENVCFCQMCKKPKAVRNIEVNNVESEPRYYWAQTRIALCLECSKRFEELRGNAIYYGRFLEAIESADYNSDKPVEVTIADATITFTQKHLAEIQEIFRIMKNTKK